MNLHWISTEIGVPDDGIEVLSWSDLESDHLSTDNQGLYELAFREEGEWFSSEIGTKIEREIDFWCFLYPPKQSSFPDTIDLSGIANSDIVI